MESIGPHHWPEDAASVLDYYRADQRLHLLRTWLSSSLLLYVGGALTIAPSFGRVIPEDGSHVLCATGIVVFVCGLYCAISGLARGLRSERYVSLRRDGLVVRFVGAPPLRIDWQELDEVRYLADERSVLLTLRDGHELRLTDRYTDVGAELLAKRIATVHRRALWGFYDRPLYAAEPSR